MAVLWCAEVGRESREGVSESKEYSAILWLTANPETRETPGATHSLPQTLSS
jgi:hypothetical protein